MISWNPSFHNSNSLISFLLRSYSFPSQLLVINRPLLLKGPDAFRQLVHERLYHRLDSAIKFSSRHHLIDQSSIDLISSAEVTSAYIRVTYFAAKLIRSFPAARPDAEANAASSASLESKYISQTR